MPKYNPKEARDARLRYERRYMRKVKEKKSFKHLKTFGIIIGALIITVSLVVFYNGGANVVNSSERENNQILVNSAYRSIYGDTIRTSSYHGKILIIYFHSLINIYCKETNPIVAAVEDDYKDDLRIITISMDPDDSNSELISWRNNLNANWILIRDDNVHDYCSEWDYHRAPFAIVIDQDGYFVANVNQVGAFNNALRTQILSLI
ncbi:MAG: TlpA family protein disulfide reductase [Candidatus Heimdallarchaeota archaeon]